ncbi:hypothetical protein CHS0354_006101 [Potamilus streckersoni]|uniref:Uncharacterized protein n=1 Tax=Potamilus streckersoni TaxID=2493646 RepID=A0AAE0STP6_9BIVA|nr:hypothetical protein CHS0354_006101 [Potamilus streckersoni]
MSKLKGLNFPTSETFTGNSSPSKYYCTYWAGRCGCRVRGLDWTGQVAIVDAQLLVEEFITRFDVQKKDSQYVQQKDKTRTSSKVEEASQLEQIYLAIDGRTG